MSKIIDIPDFKSGYATNTKLNTAFTKVEEALQDTISRTGVTPNGMEADLDLNGNSILNVDKIYTNDIYVNGETLGLQEAVEQVNIIAEDINTELASVPRQKGAWTTATAYEINDLVFDSGSTYIAIANHTSSALFSSDAASWTFFAQKGQTGSGSGDLLAVNNLSDVDDVPTARANLGLGALATLGAVGTSTITDNTVTDAKLTSDSVTTSKILDGNITFSKLSSALVDVSADTLTDSDITIPTSKLVKDYVDAAATSIFTTSYSSGNLAFTRLVSQTLTHGLGARPKLINLFLVCTAPDATYVVGDFYGPMATSGWVLDGTIIKSTSTTISFVLGVNGQPGIIVGTMAGGYATIDPTKWRVLVEAYT